MNVLAVVLVLVLAAALLVLARVYLQVARGAFTVVRPEHRVLLPLGPIRVRVAAPRELVFGTIAAPYQGHVPAALKDKLEVIERGADMVVAVHRTSTPRGLSTTVETVRFTHPERVDFRLLQGPVAHAVEYFQLHEVAGGTEIEYSGELGVDLPLITRWYAKRVVPIWNDTVRESLEGVKASAEERERAHGRRAAGD